MYPKDDFFAECRRVQETGGFSGDQGRAITQIKYTFPGIQRVDSSVQYELKAALVLEQAGIRNDLTAPWNQMTLKGVGSPQKLQQPHETSVTETAELVCEQIGLGGWRGMFASLMNRCWHHIDATAQHRIELKTEDGEYGNVRIRTDLLHDSAHLANNGFNTEGFSIPKHASGVLLSTIQVNITRKQVRKIFEEPRQVPVKYDRTPRIIDRMHFPDTLFDNWGTDPRMQLFAILHSSQREHPFRQSFEVPLTPVTRTIV